MFCGNRIFVYGKYGKGRFYLKRGFVLVFRYFKGYGIDFIKGIIKEFGNILLLRDLEDN